MTGIKMTGRERQLEARSLPVAFPIHHLVFARRIFEDTSPESRLGNFSPASLSRLLPQIHLPLTTAIRCLWQTFRLKPGLQTGYAIANRSKGETERSSTEFLVTGMAGKTSEILLSQALGAERCNLLAFRKVKILRYVGSLPSRLLFRRPAT